MKEQGEHFNTPLSMKSCQIFFLPSTLERGQLRSNTHLFCDMMNHQTMIELVGNTCLRDESINGSLSVAWRIQYIYNKRGSPFVSYVF